MTNKLLRQPWFWFALLLTGSGLLVAFLKKLIAWPSRIHAVHKQPSEQLVVLFGDSITQGGVSQNYVDLLAQRMGREGYRFLNAGINGDTAYNLLNRLGPVIESKPDAVVILIGTNDLQAYLRGGCLPTIAQRVKKLPQVVTLEWYIRNLRQIVRALQTDTPARIALCSIPILGEDLDSRPNEAVRTFNGAITALADELKVAYVPVHETMEQFLRSHQQAPGLTFSEATASGMILPAVWAHNIRGQSWDAVSARTGLVLMTDTIHFNHRGAEIIVDLIEDWLHVPA